LTSADVCGYDVLIEEGPPVSATNLEEYQEIRLRVLTASLLLWRAMDDGETGPLLDALMEFDRCCSAYDAALDDAIEAQLAGHDPNYVR
jgi:hypothetical protein